MIRPTPTQAANLLGLTRMTVYRYIEEGRLRAYRISEKKQYINIDDLDELAGTPGLLAKAVILSDLIEAGSRRAFDRHDYRCAADLLHAGQQLEWLALQRRNWHERVIGLYDLLGRYLDDDPVLQTCRDIIDAMLDTVVTPR